MQGSRHQPQGTKLNGAGMTERTCFHLRVSLRWSIHTQEPMSLSLRVTARATPPPPATRMLALSGSS